MSDTVSKKIIKNTFFTSTGLIISYLMSFLLAPYIIHKIGIERFGIWAIANTATNFFLFLDLGIGNSFVKHIAEYNTKKDYTMVNTVINTALLFSLLFCISIGTLFLVSVKTIISFFNFSPELYNDVIFTFYGIFIIFVINYIFRIFKSTLYGLQRMDITNIIFILVTIPGTIGLVLFLYHGYGLRGYVYNSTLVSLVTVMAYAACAYRVFPHLSIHPRYLSIEMFRRLWNFGFKVQVAGFAEFINTQLDKILLGYFLNVTTVAFYELGSKIALTVGNLPSALLLAIEPASSELMASNDRRGLNNLYMRGTKYLVFLSLPLALFVIVNASYIMHFWMGKPGYEKSALAIQVLTIGYAFFLLNGIGKLMARGMGHPQFEMLSALIILVTNIVLSIGLILWLGFAGALIGTSTSAVLGTAFFMNMFHKHMKWKITSILINIYLKPLLSCIIAFSVSSGVDLFLHCFDLSPSGRAGNLIYLIFKGTVFSGTYMICIFLCRYLDEYDWKVFQRTLRIPADLSQK
ncbi:MAG: oligosaccharide flippase family protein [Planctomycetes bacterium]|nr:oligosaccharide flippase family protein [Planctomycetota bacterium]